MRGYLGFKGKTEVLYVPRKLVVSADHSRHDNVVYQVSFGPIFLARLDIMAKG